MSFQHIYNLALFWHFKMLNLAPKSQLDLASQKNLYPGIQISVLKRVFKKTYADNDS